MKRKGEDRGDGKGESKKMKLDGEGEKKGSKVRTLIVYFLVLRI